MAKTTQKCSITIRLPLETRRALNEMAIERDRSAGSIIRSLLNKELKERAAQKIVLAD